MEEAGECVPFPGTVLLSPQSIPVSPCMRWCKGKKDFWWPRGHLGQNQTSLGKWIFKNQSQSSRWVPLFLPSSGFIRRILYFKWRKPNSNKFNTAPPTFGFCNLLAHEIRTPKDMLSSGRAGSRSSNNVANAVYSTSFGFLLSADFILEQIFFMGPVVAPRLYS